MAILKHIDFEVPDFGELSVTPTPVTSYSEAILERSPLAYWRLGETSGASLADETGTHPLTVSGGAALGQTGALVIDSDTATRFNGGTATSAAAVLPTTASAPFSLVFWVRSATTDPRSGSFIRQFSSNTTGHLRIFLQTSGTLSYSLPGDTTLASTEMIDTQWRMVALTRSATGTLSWFFDGQLDVQDAGHDIAIANTSFRLGVTSTTLPDLILDEFAVFDRLITADELRWLFGIGTARLALAPTT